MNIIWLLMALVGAAFCKNLPSFVEVCHRSDPKLGDCLLRNVEKLKPRLLNGIPELQVPSLNPLIFPKASVKVGDMLSLDLFNLQVYHVEECIVESFNFDTKNLELELQLFFPKLKTNATYKAEGKFMMFQLNSNGYTEGNYSSVREKYHGKGVLYTKNGSDHIKFHNTTAQMEIGESHLFYDHVFGNNEEINAQINKLLNDNDSAMKSQIKTVLETLNEEFNSQILNRLFDKFSLDELFPDP